MSGQENNTLNEVAEDYQELGWEEPDEIEEKTPIASIYEVLNARQYSEENQK